MGESRGRKLRETVHLYVGTSGWAYGAWGEIFYPPKVRSTYERLAFYTQSFNAVEVNYSFYHVPKPETCTKWADTVPRDFLFAFKASRSSPTSGSWRVSKNRGKSFSPASAALDIASAPSSFSSRRAFKPTTLGSRGSSPVWGETGVLPASARSWNFGTARGSPKRPMVFCATPAQRSASRIHPVTPAWRR